MRNRTELEKYIRKYVLFLFLGIVIIAVVSVFVLSDRPEWWGTVTVIAYAVICIAFMVRGLWTRMKVNPEAYRKAADDHVRKSFPRSIRFFQILIVLLTLALVVDLWQKRGTPFLSKIPELVMGVLVLALYIWFIRVMQKRLKQNPESVPPQEPGATPQA